MVWYAFQLQFPHVYGWGPPCVVLAWIEPSLSPGRPVCYSFGCGGLPCPLNLFPHVSAEAAPDVWVRPFCFILNPQIFSPAAADRLLLGTNSPLAADDETIITSGRFSLVGVPSSFCWIDNCLSDLIAVPAYCVINPNFRGLWPLLHMYSTLEMVVSMDHPLEESDDTHPQPLPPLPLPDPSRDLVPTSHYSDMFPVLNAAIQVERWGCQILESVWGWVGGLGFSSGLPMEPMGPLDTAFFLEGTGPPKPSSPVCSGITGAPPDLSGSPACDSALAGAGWDLVFSSSEVLWSPWSSPADLSDLDCAPLRSPGPLPGEPGDGCDPVFSPIEVSGSSRSSPVVLSDSTYDPFGTLGIVTGAPGDARALASGLAAVLGLPRSPPAVLSDSTYAPLGAPGRVTGLRLGMPGPLSPVLLPCWGYPDPLLLYCLI